MIRRSPNRICSPDSIRAHRGIRGFLHPVCFHTFPHITCAAETHLTSLLSIACTQLSSPRRGGGFSPFWNYARPASGSSDTVSCELWATGPERHPSVDWLFHESPVTNHQSL